MDSPEQELRERRRDQLQLEKLRRYESAIFALRLAVEFMLPQLQEAVRAVRKAEPIIHRIYDDFTDEVGFLGVPWENIGMEEMREFLAASRNLEGATDKWSRLNLQRIHHLERLLGRSSKQ